MGQNVGVGTTPAYNIRRGNILARGVVTDVKRVDGKVVVTVKRGSMSFTHSWPREAPVTIIRAQ